MDAVNMNGNSAFHHACFNGKSDCAEALAKAGCDLTLPYSNGRTGLQLTQKNGHTEVIDRVQRLIREKADRAGGGRRCGDSSSGG